jgi:hypothetical protein
MAITALIAAYYFITAAAHYNRQRRRTRMYARRAQTWALRERAGRAG